MKVKGIKLTNFRNHLNKEISFKDSINLIVGPNGIGKTNILEAIHLVSTAKSARTKYDSDLINYGCNFCIVLLEEENNNLEIQIIKSSEMENASSKKVKVNKVPKKVSYFTGLFNSILFTPQDINLITNPPSERRRYLDMLLSQANIDYKKKLSDYIRAVKQRNKVLEQINEGYGFGQIDYWDSQILSLGKYIQEKRIEFFDYIKDRLTENNKRLNSKENILEIYYQRNEMSKERLEKYKDKEIYAKSTLVGPHRDDFGIYLNKRNLANFGSRGQQRTSLLALKLSEIDFLRYKTNENPVLLLDDIFSELDEKHRKTIIDTIKEQQTIITSTEIPNFISDANIIDLTQV